MSEPWNKGLRYRFADLAAYGGHAVGEEVGPGVLVEYVGRNTYGHHLWGWRCRECATTHGPSTLSHVRRARMCQTCATVRENNPRWKGYRELTGVYLTQIRSDAEKRGVLFDVAPEYIWGVWEAQDGRCAYTNLLLAHGIDASLDRRDNVYGYVEGNVQWVHRDINRMKSDFSEAYFLRLCGLVAAATPQLISEFVAGRV